MTASVEAQVPSKYRRLVELGRGGMASVFLTQLQGPGLFQKLVVVKEMRPDLAEQDEFHRMFMEEARVAARLNHPNVVQTYEVLEEPPGVYSIVMEFLDGQPLSRLFSTLRQNDELAHLLHVVSQVLHGLHYLHEVTDFQGRPMGLVHRDVSPQNVFVTYDGDVKLLDFGIAKTSDSSVQTEVGTLKGKLGFMSPEQVSGLPLDRRTDIFAVGVVLWECLAGKRLWAQLAEPVIIARLVSGAIPSLREARPDVPDALAKIVERAMAHKVEDRYPDALAMLTDLDAFVATLPRRVSRTTLSALVTSQFSEDRRVLRKTVDDVLAGDAPSGVQHGVRPKTIPSQGLGTMVGDPSSPGSYRNTSAVVVTSSPRSMPPLTSVPPPAPGQGSSVAIFAVGGALLFALLVAGGAFAYVRANAKPDLRGTSVELPAPPPPTTAKVDPPPPTQTAATAEPSATASGKGHGSPPASATTARGKITPPPPVRTGARPPTDDPNDVGF